MPDRPSTADQSSLSPADAERASVCDEFTNERASLLAELRSEPNAMEAVVPMELQIWAEASFPTLEPSELVAIAVEAFQADERGFEPEYDVMQEDPSMIDADVRLYLEQVSAEHRNTLATGQIIEGVPAQIPEEAGEESRLLTAETELEEDQSEFTNRRSALATYRETMRAIDDQERNNTAELRQLQLAFNERRSNGVGTAEALRQVVAMASSPQTRQHLNELLSRVVLLQTALPDNPDVVNRLLNTAGINLTAATVAGSFGSFMAAAETDDALSDTDRATLRRIIDDSDQRLRTGTQVRDAALQTMVDPVTGEAKPIHTEDNKVEVAPSVFTYTNTGSDVILEIQEGSLHRRIDVTGLDGQSIGLVAEIMSLSALAETSGATGFMKHVYGVDFDRLADQRFDPITLNGLSTKLTHLLGAGHDGEIMQPANRRQLLQTQMRLVSPTGNLLAWEDDPDGYSEGVVRLGLDQDAVLEAFGRYTQLHSGQGMISRDQLGQYLHQRFPDTVSAPSNAEEGELAA